MPSNVENDSAFKSNTASLSVLAHVAQAQGASAQSDALVKPPPDQAPDTTKQEARTETYAAARGKKRISSPDDAKNNGCPCNFNSKDYKMRRKEDGTYDLDYTSMPAIWYWQVSRHLDMRAELTHELIQLFNPTRPRTSADTSSDASTVPTRAEISAALS